MVKRAFTLIEILIIILVVSILVIFGTSIIYNKVNTEIEQLQTQISEYQQTIDSFKEDQ